MSKRRKRNRSRRRNRSYRHRTRRNPAFLAAPRRRRSHRRAQRVNRHHNRRRNPEFLGMNMSELLAMTAGGVGNGIITRSVPQMVLGANNAGVMGYGANLVAALGGAWIIKAMFGSRAGVGAVVGGLSAVAQRVMSDLVGSKLGDLGLSGDLDFDLGFYIGNSFPLPTAGSGEYLLNPGYSGGPMPSVSVGGGGPVLVPAALPVGASAAVAAAAAPGGGGDGNGRWSGRWAA